MNEVSALFATLDWRPLVITIKTAVVTTIICFFIGMYLAFIVVKLPPKSRAFWDGILSLPLVLPPTVAGFFLLLLFSVRRPFGAFLEETFDIRVIQTWLGCIVAATVISLPLMYRNALAAFTSVPDDYLHAARTLGMSEITIFRRVIMPLSVPGLLSGTVLTFARAIGEYGATSMLAGNIPGVTATLSQRIAMVAQDGDYLTAGFWSVVVIVISFAVIYGLNVRVSGALDKR